MIKKCNKCNADFECNTKNVTKCHCYQVKLSDTQIKLLKEKYNDCLCNTCLVALTLGQD